MLVGVIVLICFALSGIFVGLNVEIPYSYSQYIAVAILACLDSVFGAYCANIEKKFKMSTFISGFFGNALIAMFLTFIGSKLDVDIYLAAVIVFSGRLLNNFGTIRRYFINSLENKKNEYDKKNKSKIENTEKYE